MKKSIQQSSKSIVTSSKRFFAGGGPKIDPNLKELDVISIGGLMAANTIKYLQHTDFHGTMAGFNSRTKFYNEIHYEHIVVGSIPPFKYMAMSFNANYNTDHSLYVPHKIVKILPNENKVIDDRGTEFSYKVLVLNTGLDQAYSNSPLLSQFVEDGEMAKSRVFVHQTYSDEQIERNRRLLTTHNSNDFIVYLPPLPSRREAYDSWYLSAESYLSRGLYSQAHNAGMKVRVITPSKFLYRFPFANDIVMEEISRRAMIETHFGWELTNIEIVNKSINSVVRYATFKNVTTGEEMRIPFGTLVTTPPNKKRVCYEGNDIADEHGQVKVNPYSLQHVKYPNIFAFGDCVNVDTTKSFYGAINQQVVARNNIASYLQGKEFDAVYEGYSSFPVNHSIDRQWIFSHKYGYQPSFGNFYVPRLLGQTVYKFKNMFERQFFSKVFNTKPNYGWPYFMKNRYFKPLDENRFLKANKLTREDVMIHPVVKPTLSCDHHHEVEHVDEKGKGHSPAH